MSTIKQKQDKQVYINKAREAEKKYGIPENTLVGLLAQESGHFDPKVISGERKSYAGAIGIGQFMTKTAKDYGIDPLNVDQAIDASAKYLSRSYNNLGNWDDAILSYNAGEGRVREYRAGKPIKLKEHQEYVDRVKNQIQTYSGIKPTFAKDIAPYMNIQQTENISYLPQTELNTTFAQTPQVNVDYLKELEQASEQKQITEQNQTHQEDNFMQDILASLAQGVEYVKPVQRDIMQSGGKIKDERLYGNIQADNTSVYKTKFKGLKKLNVKNKTDKEIADERVKAREQGDKALLNQWSAELLKPKNWTRENIADSAQGLDSKFRVSDKPNFFDDYLNPANMIGGMASNLGKAPLQAQQSDSILPYVTSIGAPLAVGALAGIGAQNTGQFVNNIANPLAGTGDLVNNLGNKYLPNAYKLNSKAFKPNPEAYYRIVGQDGIEDALQSNLIRNKQSNNISKSNTINLSGRPTAFPSFSKGKVSIEYANGLPNHGLIETERNMMASNMGRHGKGTTQFPVDSDGKYLNQFSLEEAKIYKKDWLQGYKEIPKKQEGGIIKDQEGQRKYPNQVTEIQGNIMSTDGYGNIPLYVVPDKGHPKIVMPNTGEHVFKEATKFTEYPLTESEKAFLQDLYETIDKK